MRTQVIPPPLFRRLAVVALWLLAAIALTGATVRLAIASTDRRT